MCNRNGTIRTDHLDRTEVHDDLIFDIGLHRGEDTAFYLRKGFRVVAFEADPGHVAFCRTRFKREQEQGRLTIIEGAIVDSAISTGGGKRVPFFRNQQLSVWGTAVGAWAKRNERLGALSTKIMVDAVDFVQALREHGIPHYMKIDIEGCDMVCLDALRMFSTRPQYLSIESDKGSIRNLRNELDLLADLGYGDFQTIEQSEGVVSQAVPIPAREGRYVDHRFEFGSSGLFGAELEDRWKSRSQVLFRYRLISLGYYLLGDDGKMNKWRFWGSPRLRRYANRFMRRITGAAVPGWYDTHCRHPTVISAKRRKQISHRDEGGGRGLGASGSSQE